MTAPSDPATGNAARGLDLPLPQMVSMTTRDGTRLDADVYRPQGDGPWPVLLQRQAYGRKIACTICYAHPAWYAAQGYLVIVQDVRGRGTSEGHFSPGENEAEDGAEAVEWAARLPGSDGRVAMYGFSYQAYNQLLAATADCPSLAALMPAMGPWDPATGWVYEGGALRLKQMVGWGVQITAEAARRAGDALTYARLKTVGASPPVHGVKPARPDMLMDLGDLGHFPAWVQRGPEHPFWQTISPAASAERLRARQLPVFFIGGWFDTFLSASIEAYQALARPGDPSVRLWIGPWAHFPWQRRLAGVDFGPDAALDMDLAQIAFLDAVLKGRGTLPANETVRLFDMGANRWRDFDQFPTQGIATYPAGGGRAATRIGDGRIAASPASGTEFLLHDPWRSAPATGLCYGPVPGPADRRVTDERSDVMTFTAAPQAAPVTLSGAVSLDLDICADMPSFDVSATLSVVKADGRVLPLCGGYRHLRQPPDAPVAIFMDATCVTLLPGEAIRLSIAASDFPAHPVNPGTGADPSDASAAEALITTLRLTLGPASVLHLPVESGELALS